MMRTLFSVLIALFVSTVGLSQRIPDRTQAQIDAGNINTIQARLIRNSDSGSYFIEEPNGAGGSRYVRTAAQHGTIYRIGEDGTITEYAPTADTDAARYVAFDTACAAAVDGDTILGDLRHTYETDGSIIVITGKKRLTIKDVTLTRPIGTNYSGVVELKSCEDCTITNCDFDGKTYITYETTLPCNFAGAWTVVNPNAVSASNVFEIDDCKRCIVEKSTVQNHGTNIGISSDIPFMAAAYGIEIRGAGTSDIIVRQCDFIKCGYSGVSVNHSTGGATSIIECRLIDCGTHAVRITGDQKCLVDTCQFLTTVARAAGPRNTLNANITAQAEQLIVRNCLFRYDFDWLPELDSWNVGITYNNDDYVRNSGEIYKRVGGSGSGGSAPTHDSGTVGNWEWQIGNGSRWAMKIDDTDEAIIEGTRIEFGRTGDPFDNCASIKIEGSVKNLVIRDSYLSGQLIANSAVTENTNLTIDNSEINATAQAYYGSRIDKMGFVRIEDSRIHYELVAITATGTGADNVLSRGAYVTRSEFIPWKHDFPTGSRVFNEQDIEGIVSSFHYDDSNRIIDRDTDNEYKLGFTGHDLGDTDAASQWVTARKDFKTATSAAGDTTPDMTGLNSLSTPGTTVSVTDFDSPDTIPTGYLLYVQVTAGDSIVAGTGTIDFGAFGPSSPWSPANGGTALFKYDGTEWDMLNWQTTGSGGGASAFTDLTDSPANYTGHANKLVVVNDAENAVEFVDPPFETITDYGAIADDGLEDTTAIQDAINAAETSGKPVLIPAGTFRVDDEVTIDGGSVEIHSNAGAIIDMTNAGASDTAAIVFDNETFNRTTVTTPANATAGSRSIVVGSSSNIVAGDVLDLYAPDNNTYSGYRTSYRLRERVVVQSVSGTTINLESGLVNDYSSAPTVQVWEFTRRSFKMTGKLKILGNTGITAGNGVPVIQVNDAIDPLIEGVTIDDASYAGIEPVRWFGGVIQNCHVSKREDDGGAGLSYGVAASSCQNLVVRDCYLYGDRHGFTAGGAGLNINPQIVNCALHSDASYSADFHGNTINGVFRDCYIGNGATLGGNSNKITGGTVVQNHTALMAIRILEPKGCDFEFSNLTIQANNTLNGDYLIYTAGGANWTASTTDDGTIKVNNVMVDNTTGGKVDGIFHYNKTGASTVTPKIELTNIRFNDYSTKGATSILINGNGDNLEKVVINEVEVNGRVVLTDVDAAYIDNFKMHDSDFDGLLCTDSTVTLGSNVELVQADGDLISLTTSTLYNGAGATKYSTIASAATCEIGKELASTLTITGTTDITSFGDNIGAGVVRHCEVSGVLDIVDSSNLTTIGNATITTAGGDTFGMRSDESGNWTMLYYSRRATAP